MIKIIVPDFDIRFANLCNSYDSMLSTNFVVLFESAYLVHNIVESLRYKKVERNIIALSI